MKVLAIAFLITWTIFGLWTYHSFLGNLADYTHKKTFFETPTIHNQNEILRKGWLNRRQRQCWTSFYESFCVWKQFSEGSASFCRQSRDFYFELSWFKILQFGMSLRYEDKKIFNKHLNNYTKAFVNLKGGHLSTEDHLWIE